MLEWTTCLLQQETCADSQCSDEEDHPLENEDESGRRLSIGTICQARVEGPIHHQHEDVLRYVQQALFCDMCNRLLMISIGQLIRMSLMTSLFWSSWSWRNSLRFPEGLLEVLLSGIIKPCWRKYFFFTLVKVGPSLSERFQILITLKGLSDHLMHFVHWHCCVTVIANSLLLSHVEALLVHHEMHCPPRRDASPPGKWRTTSSRLIPLSSPMSRVLRKNEVFFGLTLLPCIPVSIILGCPVPQNTGLPAFHCRSPRSTFRDSITYVELGRAERGHIFVARGVRQGCLASGFFLRAMISDLIFRWFQESTIPRNPDNVMSFCSLFMYIRQGNLHG